MAEPLTAPDWIVKGGEVGVLGSYAGSHTVKKERVKSVGKAYVVLGNGDRYHLSTLRRGDTWGWATELVRLGSSEWNAAVIAHNDRLRATRAKNAAWAFGGGRTSNGRPVPTALDLIRLLAPLTDHADAILAALPPEEPT